MIEAWEEEQMSNLGCESVSDLIVEVKRLREQLLRGVKLMNKTPNQTKEGRRNWAKRFEREVREMIE